MQSKTPEHILSLIEFSRFYRRKIIRFIFICFRTKKAPTATAFRHLPWGQPVKSSRVFDKIRFDFMMQVFIASYRPLHSTLLPFAVSLNFAPSISAALLHITMRPRKISKYSYMVQICSSIWRLSATVDFFALIFNFASVTA